ncbi:MAG: SH3 domain-containing protein [Patescibacteria group bacterium]
MLNSETENQTLETRAVIDVVNFTPLKLPTDFIENTHSRHLKPHQRVPEIMVSVLVFFVLLAGGLQHINTTSAAVMGAKTSTPSIVAIPPSPTITPAFPLPSPVEVAKTGIKPKMLTVKLDIGTNLNIREGPLSDAKVIGKASNGDIFELVSATDIGWYSIKLADGSTGFILSQFATINDQ